MSVLQGSSGYTGIIGQPWPFLAVPVILHVVFALTSIHSVLMLFMDMEPNSS